MRCVKSSKNRLGFTRLLFEGLQVWWIVDYRETWRVTGEYGLSDVNQKSKSFNWMLRFERETLFRVFFWEFSSGKLVPDTKNLGKERNESEVTFFQFWER